MLEGAGQTAAAGLPGQRAPAIAADAAGLATDDRTRTYDAELHFFDLAFRPVAGRAVLTGQGRQVRVGPVSKQFQVNGAMAIGGSNIAFLGWGEEAYWYATAKNPAPALTLMAATDVSAPGENAVGIMTYEGDTRFFIGQTRKSELVEKRGSAGHPYRE